MALLYNGLNALPYNLNPAPITYQRRSPVSSDWQNFSIGTIWINTVTLQAYILMSLSGNSADWVLFAGGAGNLDGLNADNSVVALPVGGIINLFGNSSTISTSASGNTITFSTSGLVATTFDGNTGSATPSSGVVNIRGDGTTVTTSATGNTVTISATAFSESWVEVTSTSQAMSVNTGYIANNAGLVTLTLPSVAAQGSRLTVTGKGSGGWSIAQNSGQTIYFGITTTTMGVGGSISSTAQRDTIDLVCITANTQWNVINAIGNLTVV